MRNKHLFFRKVTSFLLAGVLTASPAAAVFGRNGDVYPPKEHTGESLSAIEVTGVDDARMLELCTELLTVCHEEGREDTVRELYEEILDEYDRQVDQDALLQYRADLTNTEADSGAAMEAEDACQELYYGMMYTFREVLSGEYRQVLTELLPDESWAAYIDELELPEEETEVLLDRQGELIQEYYSRMGDRPSVVVDGETWTFERYYDDFSLDTEQDSKVRRALWQTVNESVGGIYRELASLRKEEAAREGYDSYRELAWDQLYFRDYSSSDAEDVRTCVKEVLAPVFRDLTDEMDSLYTDELFALGDGDAKKILADIAPCIGKVSPALQEAFDALTSQELYDCAVDQDRRDLGYTVALPGRGLAMIFMAMSGMWTDYEDMIHEFGHFNTIYHDTIHAAFSEESMDVSEICSQGLQLLMLPCMQEITGEETGGYMRLHTLRAILESVLEGFEADEFESAVAEDPDLSLEEINALSGKLLYDYGLTDTDEPDYQWVEKSHFYEMPFYYLSYATSALGALELLDAAHTDREDAVDRYLLITREAPSCGYLEIMEDAGLPDPFAEETIREIALAVRDELDGGADREEADKPADEVTDTSSDEEADVTTQAA
ncbi:MAG: hypothetical protein IJX90_09500 [Blautia sp.]|nr:hypothetical protein [Blautia sp.]